NVSHGTFQTTTDGTTWTDTTTFTSAQLAANHVRFQHDGGEAAPTFSLTADDGAGVNHTSNTLAGSITFNNVNDAPVLNVAPIVTEIAIPNPLPAGADAAAQQFIGPAVSNDGRFIAFMSSESTPDGSGSQMNGDVFLYDRLTGVTTVLTDDA